MAGAAWAAAGCLGSESDRCNICNIGLCPKGITLKQNIVNDRRLTTVKYRAPGGTALKLHRAFIWVLVAIYAWAVVYWVTEAVPVPVTAVLSSVLMVLLGVGSAQVVFGAYGA